MISSLLDDYNKYLSMEKDPNRSFIDLSDIPLFAPASLLPVIHFVRSNSKEFIFHENKKNLFNFLGTSGNENNLNPLIARNIDHNEAKRSKELINFFNEVINLLFPIGDGYLEYGGHEVFKYVIGEILSNVDQNSEANMVFSNSKIYSNEDYLDVGILDNGISIPGKYEESKPEFVDNEVNPYNFKNDCEAIYKALNGISTKEGFKKALRGLKSEEDIFKNDNIGFGLNTSIRLITGGLGGSFLIASRGGICHLTPKEKRFIKAKDDNILNGTLVCIRFKKAKLERDEFYKYIFNHCPIKSVIF